VLGCQPVFHRRDRDTGEMGQLAKVLVVLGGVAHDRAAAVDPQHRGCPFGKTERTMQADRDVLVHRGNRDVTKPASVAHEVHQSALEFVAAV